MSLLPDAGPGEAFAQASRFREDLFDCLTMRGDELFDLVDALLCADGPVRAAVDLTLVAEHRRGHGAMYEALNSGNVDAPRLLVVRLGHDSQEDGADLDLYGTIDPDDAADDLVGSEAASGIKARSNSTKAPSLTAMASPSVSVLAGVSRCVVSHGGVPRSVTRSCAGLRSAALGECGH